MKKKTLIRTFMILVIVFAVGISVNLTTKERTSENLSTTNNERGRTMRERYTTPKGETG